MSNSSYRRVACAGVAALIFAAVAAVTLSSEQPTENRTLTIVYTSSAHGQIRSCNCTKFAFGGYGRQATLLEKLRDEVKNLVLIEGGDFVRIPTSEQEKLKAEVALQSMNAMNYTAVVPGEAEISFEPEFLEKLKASDTAPGVVANVLERASSDPAFGKQYVIHTTADGLRVAIIGLLDPSLLPNPPTYKAAFKVSDPLETLRELLPEVGRQADFVVVVAHADIEWARSAAGTDGIDVLLCTHIVEKPAAMLDNNIVDAPAERVGDCIVVQSHTQLGWTVGRLDIQLKGGKADSFTSRLFYLDSDYPEESKIVKLYDDYNKRVRELTVGRQEEFIAGFKALLKKRGFDPEKHGRKTDFVSASECKTCHQQAYDTWEKSAHAGAMKTLEKTDQQFDPECVRCHTTGTNQRGGFVNLARTPELADVQCEACHGPGRSHKQEPGPKYGPVGEDTCRACHTQDLDPEFDYDKSWKKVEHRMAVVSSVTAQ